MNKLSARLPIFKKKITSFLSKEDGKISKENLIKAGILVATISISSQAVKSAVTYNPVYCPGQPTLDNVIDKSITDPPYHSNSMTLTTTSSTVTGTHQHCASTGHASHSSHSSHASHGSHGSGGWC